LGEPWSVCVVNPVETVQIQSSKILKVVTLKFKKYEGKKSVYPINSEKITLSTRGNFQSLSKASIFDFLSVFITYTPTFTLFGLLALNIVVPV
jgi:hypothetical protein